MLSDSDIANFRPAFSLNKDFLRTISLENHELFVQIITAFDNNFFDKLVILQRYSL